MCKTVYITHERFDKQSERFAVGLKNDLSERGFEVIVAVSNDLLNFFREHKTYGIAIAIDFYKKGEQGRGLTLNSKCSLITREFAYNLSNTIDLVGSETIKWRAFEFVKSDDKNWFKFFNKVSAEVKLIFHPCNSRLIAECEDYSVSFEKTVKFFADEIVRCLRADCDYLEYKKRVRLSKVKLSKTNKQ